MNIISLILYNLMEVHPLHSLLVHFPIALISSALFFILLALWRKSDTLEIVAFANISLATVSTLVAGLAGLRDNNDIYDGGAPNANTKIILASILLIVTSLVTFVRWRRPDIFHSSMRILYVGGYFVSFALVAILGFLGGVILYGFVDIPTIPVTGNSGSVDAAHQTIPTPTSEPLPTEVTASGVSFAKDVFPILKSRCINCHGGQKTEEDLNLTSYELLMAGSKNGPVVIQGDIVNSLLVQTLIEREMPKRGPKLSPEQAQLIVDWIKAGALDN